jgi:hypothetical protein
MRPKLTYANAVATLALFVALGGASYAAFKVPKNSVGLKQLRKNAVATAKIRNEAVTNEKIKNEAITAEKVRAGSLTGAQINASTLGEVPAAGRAADAATLGGLTSSDFAQSSRFLSGQGRTNASPAQTVFTVPGEFLLKTTDKGSLLPHLTVENISSDLWDFLKKTGESAWTDQAVNPGASAEIAISDAEAGTFHAVDRDNLEKHVVVSCTYAGASLVCTAILSPAV